MSTFVLWGPQASSELPRDLGLAVGDTGGCLANLRALLPSLGLLTTAAAGKAQTLTGGVRKSGVRGIDVDPRYLSKCSERISSMALKTK